MIQLKKTDYFKVDSLLRLAEINTLFAQTVTRNMVNGAVYVDDVKNPKAFYIAHPYGMSLLIGRSSNRSFIRKLGEYFALRSSRGGKEYLQVYPNDWADVIRDIPEIEVLPITTALSGRNSSSRPQIIESTRINFLFDLQSYTAATAKIDSGKYNIIQTTIEMYHSIEGSVIPKDFWNSGEDFTRYGIAYSLIQDGDIASTAFSSFVIDNKLEIGIETMEEYRGKGYASMVCKALIDYCVTNDMEPVWSCNGTNTGSENLAKKLGFRAVKTLPYFLLS